VGIDPQSRSHILEGIRQLAAGGVGVIYASHYMEEVEAICRRVAVIDHGKLLALGTLDELIDKASSDLHMRVAAHRANLERRLMGLAEVVAVNDRESTLVIRREAGAAAGAAARRLARVTDLLVAAGIDILSVETRQQNLESLFLEMTGRTLRD